MSNKDTWPERWKIANLDEVVDRITNGINLPQLDLEIENSFPISRIETIADESINFNRVKYVLTDENILKKYSLQEGDILFSHINSDKHLGKTAIYEGERVLIHGVNLLLIRANSKINRRLLNYLFRHYRFQGKFIEAAQRAVNQSSINQKKLKAFAVPLIDLGEQQHIVAKLDALFGHLDSLKEKLDRIPKLLKSFRQQVLTQAVKGELTREWREGKGLGEWKTERLEDISKRKLGKMLDQAKNKGELVDYLRNINVRWFEIDFNDLSQMRVEKSELHKYELMYGDILICEGGEPGRAAIWKNERSDIIFQKALHRVRLNDDILPDYFLFNLFVDASTERLNDLFTGTTIKHLTGKSLAKYQIDIPSKIEQTEIVRKVNALFELADKIETRYQSLKARIDQLPQAILAKAFRGELVEQEVKEHVGEAGEVMMAGKSPEAYKMKGFNPNELKV